jgi:hypothetical protein
LNDASVLADRPILSHSGWREWALRALPLRSDPSVQAYLAASDAENSKKGFPLSGRALRRLVPQVSESVMPSAGTQARQLWCWGQFHTSKLAPARESIRDMFDIDPDLRRQLVLVRDDLLAFSALSTARKVVVVHHRVGEGYAVPGMVKPATLGEWRDPNQVFVSTPEAWVRSVLEQFDSDDTCVVFCADDAVDGENDLLRFCGERGLPVVVSTGARNLQSWQRVKWDLVGFDEAQRQLVFDFFLMQSADVLVLSNSTLSLWAAMLASRADQVCLRPDPALGRFDPIDPWNCTPLEKWADYRDG